MKFASQTSTVPWRKSVAQSRGPLAVSAIASPLKIASGTVAAICACVEPAAGTFGFQPLITPASEENRKRAAPEAVPECTANAVADGLKTRPVGAPPGMLTTSGTIEGFGAVALAPE